MNLMRGSVLEANIKTFRIPLRRTFTYLPDYMDRNSNCIVLLTPKLPELFLEV